MAGQIFKISGEHLQEIKSALGAPLITNQDWGGNTDDYIRKNIVKRVIRQYYTLFPIKIETVHQINGIFIIDYPTDDKIFRMFRHFFNYKTEGLQNFNNPFFLQSQVIDRRSHPFLRPYHLNEIFGRLTSNEALINFSHALRVEDYMNERQIRGSTTTVGTLSVQWAKYSDDFGTIPFTFLDDAIKLGKAYFMQDAARLRDSMKLNASKVDIDGAALLRDGTRWEEEVMDSWKNRGFPVIIK